ncbi:MAG: insulinase family protein [Pyrinomonadaceae bacterium]|nr:insulinase family protein [Pyrinomonadaceae bacterium]
MLRIFVALIVMCTAVLANTKMDSSPTFTQKMPKINYRERTLPNGLKVYTLEDHSSPTVSIQVWYHVGSKDDPNGRSGFAHLFEHMMFKSTKNMKAEMMDRLTEDVGGFNNAFTADDVTVYFDVVPSNYLETLLWAEADRLGSLNIDDANFKSERDVVKEEYRETYMSRPYGKLELLIQQKSFTKHPYRRPGIGNIEELNAATLTDVKSFHQTFYRPDNATLVVAGDFDQKQLDAWVDKYFGRIPKANAPLPRVNVKEPERTKEARYVEYGEHEPLPAVAISYLAPPQASDDAFALRVAGAILAAGESSRLYQSLIYRQQLASQVDAETDFREDTSLFLLRATMASGKTAEEGEKALLAELKRLQTETVSAAELEKAKNQVITERLKARETSNGKAFALGEAAVLLGDANRVNTDNERLMAVTAQDVQRVMKKYFTGTNRVVIYFLPRNPQPDGEMKMSKNEWGAGGNSAPTVQAEGGR